MEKKSILEELKSIQSKASECSGRLNQLSSIVKKLGDEIDEIAGMLSPTSKTLIGQKTGSTIRRQSGTMVGVHHSKPPSPADSR